MSSDTTAASASSSSSSSLAAAAASGAAGLPPGLEANLGRWMDIIRRSSESAPYIVCSVPFLLPFRAMSAQALPQSTSSGVTVQSQSQAGAAEAGGGSDPHLDQQMASLPFLCHLDHDVFACLSGPTIAAISVVFDNAEDEAILARCAAGFVAAAEVAAAHGFAATLDDITIALCRFATLPLQALPTVAAALASGTSVEEALFVFGDDPRARQACLALFTITNQFGDYTREGWRNFLDTVIRMHKVGLLPAEMLRPAREHRAAIKQRRSDPTQGTGQQVAGLGSVYRSGSFPGLSTLALGAPEGGPDLERPPTAGGNRSSGATDSVEGQAVGEEGEGGGGGEDSGWRVLAGASTVAVTNPRLLSRKKASSGGLMSQVSRSTTAEAHEHIMAEIMAGPCAM